MPWGVAAAGVASAAAGAAASTSAANTEAHAANSATNAQLGMFNKTQGNLAPFMTTGVAANSTLASLLGINNQIDGGIQFASPGEQAEFERMLRDPTNRLSTDPTTVADQTIKYWGGGAGSYTVNQPDLSSVMQSPLLKPFTQADFQSSPGYNFQLQQGLDAVNNNAAAKGPTGNTLKDLMTYGEGLANQDWWNAYNAYTGRQNQTFNMLSGVSGSGQSAAANLGGIGANTAGQIGNNVIGAGNASAAGTIGASNAFGGAANNIGQNYMLYQLMQNMQPGGVTSVTSMGGSPAY